MSDTTQVEKKEKKPVAKKFYVDASGKEADQEKATGVSYESLASKNVFVYQIPDAIPGEIKTMLALFGATTQMTNTSSTNRQGLEKGDADAFEDDVEAIKARFERIAEGEWGGKGGGGIRIDVDTLFDAVTEAAGGTEPEGGREAWVKSVTDDAAIRTAMRNHSAVAPIYERKMREKRPVKAEKSLGDLLGAVKI